MARKKNKAFEKPVIDFSMNEVERLDGKVADIGRFRLKDRNLAKRKILISRIKRRLLKHVLAVRLILVLLFLFILGGGIFLGVQVLKKSSLGYWTFLARTFAFPPSGVVPTINGRTNVLILGKSGTGQDSPDLTDTMIVASISEVDRKVNLISIPRDIWIPDMRAKINSAYYYGKQKGEGSYLAGIVLAKSTVEEVVGIPIQYAVVVDFSGFEKIIDEVDGIDVVIEHSFVDHQYPVPGREADLCSGDPTFACRYQTIEFKQGLQHMDGATALKFVRSRHAEGDEGSDLARALRQQKVMKAMVAKILTPSTFLSLQRDSDLLTIINSSLETDIPAEKALILTRWVVDSRNNVATHAVPDQFLYDPPTSALYDNQFVYIPRKGDWSDLQNWVRQNLY